MDAGQLVCADGTPITYEVRGSGPVIVIVPGTLRAAKHYRAIADNLADAHTVYVVNRLGRFGSGAKGADYGVEKEVEDLAVVLDKSGPAVIFGHSYGGFVALEYARKRSVDRIAVYEPALSIDGSIPTGWLPGMERALVRGNPARGLTLKIKGLALGGILNLVPAGVFGVLAKLMMHTEEGRDIAELLPDGHLVTMPKAGHNAPDQDGPAAVAAELRQFLATHLLPR